MYANSSSAAFPSRSPLLLLFLFLPSLHSAFIHAALHPPAHAPTRARPPALTSARPGTQSAG